ncbi:serine hydrolase domain-containing protein [Streptomyces sp. NPDC090022]|uniref:serine hydrolase domain-containing protein n=1 Tax=Streptomyces sp. NPDC090022 TaxID=3365920 RepID=UPI0038233773
MGALGRFRGISAAAAASLLLAALCAGPAPAAAPPGRPDLDPATVQRLDDALAAAMERGGFPGMNVGLWIDGGGSYQRSLGVSDQATGAPMKADLFHRIGSVTKTFTVTAVLQLVDEGRIGLDDPIARYVDGVPGGERITVRQLAGMRSGLYDYTLDPTWMAEVRANPQRVYTPRQLLDIAFAHPAQFPPGTKWMYSNTNTVLLGLLIEKVGGQPLAAFLREHVFDALHLNDTSLPKDGAMPTPYAHGYTDFSPSGKPVDSSLWNPSWAWAAGAVISDLDDLRAWVPALADGRLLEPATQAQRMRMTPTGHPGLGYGLGILSLNGWVGHNGDIPGYETLAIRLPAERTTLVVLINSDIDNGTGSLSSLIGKTVTEIVTPRHPFAPPSAAQPNQPNQPGVTPSPSGG